MVVFTGSEVDHTPRKSGIKAQLPFTVDESENGTSFPGAEIYSKEQEESVRLIDAVGIQRGDMRELLSRSLDRNCERDKTLGRSSKT